MLNGGQQRKASLDKDITVRIIAFYGRVNYSSQVFARIEAPQKRVGSLSSRLFLGRGGRDNIQLTVPRDKSLVDYVYMLRVHFRWLDELERDRGYKASLFSFPKQISRRDDVELKLDREYRYMKIFWNDDTCEILINTMLFYYLRRE